ncbi:helix-turn-helix transcriptional regulator [Lactococcus lactis]|uniref:helix-turn-helix transcriptional regulator n=1 Tax=Lactococcus lactis TaxID=1358 RepID=UPI00223A9C17|nr:XRE family transcriptional regulator [Lactococcus lactis]
MFQATYNCYENGLRVPDNEIILRFAKYYDVSPAYMFGFCHLQNEAEYYKEILEHISENGDSDGSYARIALEELVA